MSSGDVTYIVEAYLGIDEQCEWLPMFATKLGHYPIVLGILWLKQHDVTIYFASNLITFWSQYYLAHCNDSTVMVRGTTEEPPEYLSVNTTPLSIAKIRPVPLT
jgi:hypothetical protein